MPPLKNCETAELFPKDDFALDAAALVSYKEYNNKYIHIKQAVQLTLLVELEHLPMDYSCNTYHTTWLPYAVGPYSWQYCLQPCPVADVAQPLAQPQC